ncbi:MAG TPA: glycosyltransferase family 4 protein [Acidimicrobiales bacterium]|jgi:D-inositol-3-phosphate glycosyltransferase|nr:glycosyltransferase family 4 protein [Acidimicrobiales bacterium]
MTEKRRPLLRVHHVWIRFWARRRERHRTASEAAARRRAHQLRGHVDEPIRGQRVEELGFTVRGWCAWGDRPALAVAVCVDGVVVGHSAVGSVPRHDVAQAARSENLGGTGWQVHVGAGSWSSEDSVELSVLVWADAGAQPIVLDRFPVIVDRETGGGSEGTAYEGDLYEPRAGEQVDEAFLVRGWVMRNRQAVGRLDVLVNGKHVGRARLGLPRFDPGGEGPAGAIISGFEHWVDLSSAPPATTVTLQLVAGSSDDPPEPLFDRVLRVRTPPPATDRSDRATVQAQRRERLLSAIVAPRSPDLDLVAFTHQLGYGGGQLWLDEFLKRAGAGDRFACTVISYKDGPLRAPLEQRGIAVHVTDMPPVHDAEAYEGRITELAALVAAGGHNVALVNTAPLFSGADVALRLSLPVVWAVHESFTPRVLMRVAFGSRVDPGLFETAKRSMEAADAVVFEAEATRELYGEWARPGSSVVVPYGVDTSEILNYERLVPRHEARAKLGIAPESRMILVMATIEQRKAQTRIAQAFRAIAAAHPDWELVFVGDTKSDYSRALKQYVRKMGLSDRCTIVPVDDDVYQWYRAADLLLSASDVESLPRSMLEVMCFGVPVVAASVFGVPELVTDGETGFLFEPNDLDALVGGLDRVLSLEPAALARVGAAGRHEVIEHYDSSGYSGDLLRLCEGLLRRPGANPREILSERGRRANELDLDAAL